MLCIGGVYRRSSRFRHCTVSPVQVGAPRVSPSHTRYGQSVHRAWVGYLGVLLVGVLVYAVLPSDGTETVEYLVLALSGPVAVLVGVRAHRPAYAAPWYLAAAGLGCYFLGDLVYYSGVDDLPGPADAFYLGSYPFMITALLLLIRRRDPGRDVTSLVDAGIIAAAVTLLYWVYVAEPVLNSLEPAGRAVTVAVFIADIVLLAVAARLVATAGTHRPAFYLVTLGVVALLTANVLYSISEENGKFAVGTPLDAGWLLYYGLWGAAALHPSMRTLAEPAPTRSTGTLSSLRLTLLTTAVLAAPAVLIIEAARRRHTEYYAIAAVSVILFGLVMARIAVLVRAANGATERERALREAAAAFVATGQRRKTYEAALDAVSKLVGDRVTATRIIAVRDQTTTVVAARGSGAGSALDAVVDLRRLPSPVGEQTGLGEVPRVADLDDEVAGALHLRECSGELLLAPVMVDGALRGALLAVTRGAAPADVSAALETLSSQVALALESAALTEELHTRQSEARFRALVQNSSDAIILVDNATVIHYQTPSAEQVLGFPPEELTGSPFLDLVDEADALRASGYFAELAQRDGLSGLIELRLRRQNGVRVDCEVVGSNLQRDANVESTVLTIRDVSERKRFERQLSHQAFHDALTGLANRALFNDRLTHALARRVRDSGTLAVVLIDLDDFKFVNDSLGHLAGDSLLIDIAERLQHVFRPTDTTSRLGGDEFAILLESLPSEDGALRAVERAIERLREPLVVEGKEVFVEASVGIAFADDDGVTSEDLLRNADVAMYVAKTQGKSRYAVYESRMHAAALQRLDLRADLQRALDNDEFLLYYQPIVSLDTSRTVSLEALVRWEHPQRGMVAPGDFMELAEETGLIVALGRWVIDHACQQASDWADYDGLSMSINLSQKQLQAPGLAEDVRDSLARSGVDPTRIVLEITESAVMADVQSTVRTLHALRALGVRLAVDDFGTGYSSLSWLRQLPVDVLKIDKEFVDGIAVRNEDSMLVGAVIDLAHNLGLRTVAEGIEGPDQLAGLRRLRCDFGQGYLFARPMSAVQVQSHLKAEGDAHVR
jgi:diguanylate cyclase (GGDEF)-like protein/PAS domain S-box-containing protein